MKLTIKNIKTKSIVWENTPEVRHIVKYSYATDEKYILTYTITNKNTPVALDKHFYISRIPNMNGRYEMGFEGMSGIEFEAEHITPDTIHNLIEVYRLDRTKAEREAELQAISNQTLNDIIKSIYN